MLDLAAFASSLPSVTPGVACAGTSLESRTFSVHDKAFLFVSPQVVRLKLGVSADEARGLGFVVGANGWVKIPVTELPRAAQMRKWIAESHASMVPAGKRDATRSRPRGGSRSR